MEHDLVLKQKQDIELTKLAYSYSQKVYSHNEIIAVLLQNDEIEKQICIINLENLNSEEEAKLLTSHLTNHPTPVREITSYKILEFLSSGKHSEYFQDENTLNIFLAGVVDINPAVSRNVIGILEYIENRKYCINSLKSRINALLKEINDIPKNKSYLANKKNFSLYWYLEALYVFLKRENPDEEIISILDICSKSCEYTIREKCAKIASLFKQNVNVREIFNRLALDENFYVRNNSQKFSKECGID